MAMPAATPGQLFAVPLPDGTYLHGRVLLNIERVFKKRLLPADSPITFYRGGYLVEMYSAVQETPDFVASRVLIPGAFVRGDQVGASWPVVGTVPVNPRSVEFPEAFTGHSHDHGGTGFRCGEIRYPLPFPGDVAERVQEYTPLHSSFLWGYTCLRVLGRDTEIPSNYAGATLRRSDLRLSDFRDEVYKHLPFKKEQSYFEKQAQLGLKFERLYE